MKKFITTISYNNHIDTYGADVAALPKITSEELPYTSSTHNSAM